MDLPFKLIAFLFSMFLIAPICFAQETQFSDEAIDKRVDRIKAEIINKQKFNVKILGSANSGHSASGNNAFDRAYLEENNRDSSEICAANNVKNILSNAIREYCFPDGAIRECREFQEKAQFHSQAIFRQMTSVNGGMETVLEKIHESLQSALRTTIQYNDMCSSKISSKLFSNDCIGSYDRVLTQSLTEQLTRQCSTTAIDQTIQEFKDTMRNIYVKKIDDVRDAHIKSRELEGELALKISEIRAQIQKLRNAEPVRTAELSN